MLRLHLGRVHSSLGWRSCSNKYSVDYVQRARREVEEAGLRLEEKLASIGLSGVDLSKKEERVSVSTPDYSFNSQG